MTSLMIYPDLYRDEGKRNQAYKDTLGNWTIGVGHKDNSLHEGVLWDDRTVDTVLRQDVSTVMHILDGSPIFSPWWRTMNDFRQDALVNMGFNMGCGTLGTFNEYLEFLREGQYAQAADDELHTLWAKQVGQRAFRIAEQIRSGEHQQ